MKKIYLLAALASVITLNSCSNDQEIDNGLTNTKAIGFRTFIDKGNGSKAAVTTSDNILSFTVTGWWDREKKGTIDQAVTDGAVPADQYMFNGFDISRREAGITNWTYTPVRYWPAEEIIGGGITFFAYSPAASKHVTTGLTDYTGAAIAYTVPDIYDTSNKTQGQEDFLLARTDALKGKNDDDANSKDNVELTFAHALSRVKFSARTTNTGLTYVIGGVELVNIAKSGTIDLADIPVGGTFTYNDTDPTGDGPVVLWEKTGTTSDLGLDIGESPINLLGEYKSLLGDYNALMVLPQTTVAGAAADEGRGKTPTAGFWIKVSYKAYLNNPDKGTYFAGSKEAYEDRYFRVIDPLRSTSETTKGFSFEIGRQYNFYLTFGDEAEEAISFEVAVGDWSDAD
ncbi:fimbrillin family protein [Parabacteroides sp. OttesenSCG-928-O15]|nr:fimbrillin family protein [Parabacteroides sp. OttesenSCG-928-O15]